MILIWLTNQWSRINIGMGQIPHTMLHSSQEIYHFSCCILLSLRLPVIQKCVFCGTPASLCKLVCNGIVPQRQKYVIIVRCCGKVFCISQCCAQLCCSIAHMTQSYGAMLGLVLGIEVGSGLVFVLGSRLIQTQALGCVGLRVGVVVIGVRA